jgi:hypothetical protein
MPDFGSMDDLVSALNAPLLPSQPIQGGADVAKARLVQALNDQSGAFNQRFSPANDASTNGSWATYHVRPGHGDPQTGPFYKFTSSIAPSGIPWETWPQSTHIDDRRNDIQDRHTSSLPMLQGVFAADRLRQLR